MKVVLQLDDDIILSRNCLFKLYNKIKNKNNIAIAPKYLLSQKKSKIYKKPNSYLLKVYHWLINSKKGYNPGTISLSGFNYADENKKKGIKEHEWLPGGIIIHKKKNLILKNYYPFNFKKSYCEDVLHSLLLREKKIKLMKYYEATVRDLTPGNIVEYDSFGKTLKNLYSEFLIRYYIVTKFSFSRIRLFIYYLIYFLRILLRKIRIWIK